MLACLKRWPPAIHGIAGDMFVFQQDSTPAHRARDTLAFLARETPQFIGPELLPPNSLDLNPVDYTVWVSCRTLIQDVDDLEQHLIAIMQQSVIDEANDQW